MLRLMLNTAFTVLAKEGKENVTVTLDSMINCLETTGLIILNSRSGSVYIRYSPAEHNLTAEYGLFCTLYISAPSGTYISFEILAERTNCWINLRVIDITNGGVVRYCDQNAPEDMRTSKKWIMPSDLVKLFIEIFGIVPPLVLHLRFKAVQSSYELQVHYDSPKQGK